MSEAQVRSLARRLASLEKWRLQSKQPNLGFSTIEGGALQATDEDGVVRTTVGQQGDGTYTVVDVNGPPPPVPTDPTVDTSQPGLMIISSYGLTVGDVPWPMDFRRIDVHVGSTPGFTTTIATRVTEFSTDGGVIALALIPGNYYVKLVAVSTSGTKSAASGEVPAVVVAPVTDAGVAIYRTDAPPVGLGPDDADKAFWYDTDNGNLQSYWDGDSWEPMPLGPGATSDDVIAGKKVPLNTRIELQWGVPDPDAAPDFLYESLKPVWHPFYGQSTTTRSYRGMVSDGGSLVQIESLTDNAGSIRSHRPVFISETDGSLTYGDFLSELNVLQSSGSGSMINTFPYILGVTKLGTTWYILAQKQSVSPAPRAELFRYDSSWNFLGSLNVGTSGETFCPYHGLTNDGTNLLTTSDADVIAGSNPTKIEAHNPTTWATVSTVTITGSNLGTAGTKTPVDLLPLANYDFGAARYVVLATDGGFFPGYQAVVVDSTGAEQATTFPVKAGYLGDVISSIRWNSTTSQYQFGVIGDIYRTTSLASDVTVWTGYTLYDSVADPDTHESALSPVTSAATTVRKRHGLFVNGYIPTVDDAQAPDTIRVYARVNDVSQPAPAAMDLQTHAFVRSGVNTNDTLHRTTVGVFVEPVNGGAAPPTVSSFPAAPSGEIVSELGGMVIRGDGTIDAPFLARMLDERYDARYASAGHTHAALEARTSVLEAASPRLTAAEADIDTLQASDSAHTAAITALQSDVSTLATASSSGSGSYTRTIYFARVGQMVFAFGDLDRASGFNATSHDTGVRIPIGFRPSGTVVGTARTGYNSTSQYRYRFFPGVDASTAGVVELQQTAAVATFQVCDAMWITDDAAP